MAFIFVLAYLVSMDFQEAATAQFPRAVLMAAIPLAALVVLKDARACSRTIKSSAGFSPALIAALSGAEIYRSLQFAAYLLGIVGITYLAGQLVALPLFVIVYLRTWGQYRWSVALAYAAMTFLMVWGFYGQLMNLLLHPSLLF